MWLAGLDIETKQGKALGEGIPIAWTSANTLLGCKMVKGFKVYQFDPATGKDTPVKLEGVKAVGSVAYNGGLLVTDMVKGNKLGLISLETRKIVGTVTLQKPDQTELDTALCVLK